MARLGPTGLTQVFTEIKNWVLSKLNSKANDSDVVHKTSNETITGDKHFDGYCVDINGYRLRIKGTNQEVGIVPTDGNRWNGFRFVDKNNVVTFAIENGHLTDGRTLLSFKLVDNKANVLRNYDYVKIHPADENIHRYLASHVYPYTNNKYDLGASSNKWNNIYATTFNGNLVGNATTATKATKDSAGNTITSTYATKTELTNKQNALTDTQLSAVNSGITATKVNEIDNKANDSDVVHKSEDETITGIKTFNNSLVKTGSGNWGNILTLKNIDTIKGTAPASDTINNAIRFASSDYTGTYSTTEAEITVQKLTTGDNRFTLAVSSNSNTSASGMAGLSLYSNKKASWNGDFTATAFHGNLVGNADTATKATNNASGNELSNNIIKGLSVRGKVITYTKLDGSTGTITTQDTNTDTKVTNTLDNTTKAYITGTTSEKTNTGTQIFDSGVYLTTTAGQLHADIDFPITETQVNEILGISQSV